MTARRAILLTPVLLAIMLQASCQAPGDRIMSYEEYRGVRHATPCVLEARLGDSQLVYYGAAHFTSLDNPQAGDIERRWAELRPDFALNEGGDPPAETLRETAVGRHGEAGLLRWLAKRDGVPIRSLDPTREEEVAALRPMFTAEDLTLFYVLRRVMQDARRAPEFRRPSVEKLVEDALVDLSRLPGLEGEPRTLAEFEAACRRRAPGLTDWRTVPPEWFDPAAAPPPAFTNAIARASSEFRDRFIVDALEGALREHSRVFAAVGASHVVMQEPELRRRFDVEGPFGLLLSDSPDTSPAPVVSLLGKTLEPPAVAEERRQELMRKLTEYTQRAGTPHAGEDDFIWLGRTLAYLHQYREAIDAFTRGLERYPESHRLLRHRGHRYITVRDLDRAAADLEQAASLIQTRQIADEVEPDGAPNRSGIPRSTTNTNIYYHLGLVAYLQGDFQRAADHYRACLAISPNDDMTVAAVHWLYMSLRRSGQDAVAATMLATTIHPNMQIMENDAYFRLCRMYQGAMTPEEALPVDADPIGMASTGYGVATWHWCEGRKIQARELLEQVAASPLWPAFGVIAAEADLARLQRPGE